jgi:tetratricopeptide (TPR) repeat protein
LIDEFKSLAKLHQIAEINLKIADIYANKLSVYKLEKFHILESINYLQQESNLLKDFNQSRTLTQNFQNIAELYLRLSDYENALMYYQKVIEISKAYEFYDLLSYSYQQIASCYKELDDYNKANEIILDGIEYFANLSTLFEEKNENLALAQICQILKNLYLILNDKDQFLLYSKREAGAYIDLAESIEKSDKNLHKIAQYYRGAALCYQELHNNNLLEAASCFLLAGNYSDKIEDFNNAAINFFDAANVFKEMENWEMTYKLFIKAGDNYWKINEENLSTESYLNAYDIAIERNLEFNRFGIFNQIVRGLNKVAKQNLKNKQFYSSATLILESIKFYEQLDTSKDFLLEEMVRNVYRYYYRAANMKKIGVSHIVQSYLLASLSCLLIGKLAEAWSIISEMESEGNTINNYKEMIRIIMVWLTEGKDVEIQNFPYHIKRLIYSSEEILYLVNLFNRM